MARTRLKETVLSILVLSVFILGVFLALSQRAQESNTSSQTTGRKTYTNAHFGFMVTYPSQWKLTENPDAEFQVMPSFQPLGIVTMSANPGREVFQISVVSGNDPLGLVSHPGGVQSSSTIVDGVTRQAWFDTGSSAIFVAVQHAERTYLLIFNPATRIAGDFAEVLSSFKLLK